jgi:hypothetical protein
MSNRSRSSLSRNSSASDITVDSQPDFVDSSASDDSQPDFVDNETQTSFQASEDCETQTSILWDSDQLKVLGDHYDFHSKMCSLITKLRNGEHVVWPRLPGGSLKSATKAPKRHLSGQELHNYLADRLTKDTPVNCVRAEDCDSNNLADMVPHLILCYDQLKTQTASTLSVSIDFGQWLILAYEMYLLSKPLNGVAITWKMWVEENVGISKSYECKLREMARLLSDYPRFRRLSLSFSEAYKHKKELQSMLLAHSQIRRFWRRK